MQIPEDGRVGTGGTGKGEIGKLSISRYLAVNDQD
jgi:hypothetical protein